MTREDATDIIQSILDKYEENECLVAEITIGDEDIEALKLAIKALEQEPFINKPCVSSEVCEHDKNVVLDKIRAEIKALTSNRGFLSCSVDHIHEKIDAVFDKYKSESEE